MFRTSFESCKTIFMLRPDNSNYTSLPNHDRNTIRICNNTIYRHCTARINYTTYDMRRDYDTINPRTHPFIMVPSPETEIDTHPFWYAAVLGIFHAEVQHTGRLSSDLRPKIIEFLWIRWLGQYMAITLEGNKQNSRSYPFFQMMMNLDLAS